MKIIIIGGVAGGMSAAARLRRLDEKSDIIVIEKSGYVSFANCGLPYYIGGVIKEEVNYVEKTINWIKYPIYYSARFSRWLDMVSVAKSR